MENRARDGLDMRLVAMRCGYAGFRTRVAATCSRMVNGMRNAKSHLVRVALSGTSVAEKCKEWMAWTTPGIVYESRRRS